jgi:hypothetical protein
MVSLQAYADLLKASWILIDIISKHPQIKFWSPTSEYLQVQLLAEVCCFSSVEACLARRDIRVISKFPISRSYFLDT